MSWELTVEQRDLQQQARALAREAVAPRAADVDRSEQYPWDNVTALQRAGFCAMTVPAVHGGPGRSLLDAVLVVEEMAKVCGVTGRIAVECNMGALSAVMAYGTGAQRSRVAELVLAGDKPAICITEPGGRGARLQRDDHPGGPPGRPLRGQRRQALDHRWWRLANCTSCSPGCSTSSDGDPSRASAGFIAVPRRDRRDWWSGKREPTMGLRGISGDDRFVFEDMVVRRGSRAVQPPSAAGDVAFAQLMTAYNSQRVGAATVALGHRPSGARTELGAGSYVPGARAVRTSHLPSSRVCSGCWPT